MMEDFKERLRKLKGRFSGRRCFIMGNGPSLNRMDLGLLEREQVWGANRCFLLFDRVSWRPAFYTAMDPLAIQNSRERISGMIREFPRTRFFFPIAARDNGWLDSADNVYFYREEPGAGFSLDAARGVAQVHTVTAASLQLAAFLGFNPIYLIGCDLSYAAAAGLPQGTVEGFKFDETGDTDHFHPNYLNGGDIWRVPEVEGMLEDYRLAHRALDSVGVAVYNATIGGRLEEFPRTEYPSLFWQENITSYGR